MRYVALFTAMSSRTLLSDLISYLSHTTLLDSGHNKHYMKFLAPGWWDQYDDPKY